MRISILSILPVLCSALGAVSAADPKEISTRYEVELNGKKTVVDTSGSKIRVGNKSYPIAIRQLETKSFNDGQISFDFPSRLSSSKEVEDELWTWDFNGDHVYFAVFRPDKEHSKAFSESYVDSLKKTYPAETPVKSSGVTLHLGARQISGTRFELTLVGQNIVQEIFNLEVQGQWY